VATEMTDFDQVGEPDAGAVVVFNRQHSCAPALLCESSVTALVGPRLG